VLPGRCNGDTFSTSSLKKNIVAFQLVGYPVWNGEAAGSNPVYYTLLPDSVMVNISHFDCDVLSSPDSYRDESGDESNMLALAYLVKHPSVQRKNRVRVPESTNTAECNGNIVISLSF
jgi:hypothetical protein